MGRSRTPIKVLAAVVLGIVSNCVVAWALAWWPTRPRQHSGIVFYVPIGEGWGHYHLDWLGGPGRDSVTYIRRPPGTEGPRTLNEIRAAFVQLTSPIQNPQSSMTLADSQRDASRYFPSRARWAAGVTNAAPIRRVYAAGFPFRSFRGHISQATNAGPLIGRVGLIAVDPTNPVRAVPVIPMPLGVLLNSALFALLWVVVLWWPPTVRRRHRLRRGRCPHCKYDLRGDFSGPCSECGRMPGVNPHPQPEGLDRQ